MKHYLVQRTVFNPEALEGRGEFQTDTLSMNQKVYDAIVSQKTYQEDLRDNKKPTPIKLVIEKEFKDHFAYMKYAKELKSKIEAAKQAGEVDEEEEIQIKQYTEKGLKLMKEEKLKAILVDIYEMDLATLDGVEKSILIESILEKQTSK